MTVNSFHLSLLLTKCSATREKMQNFKFKNDIGEAKFSLLGIF